MKTFIIALMLICFFSLFSYSQINEKNAISISLGASVPIGQFAQGQLRDGYSGLPKTGFAKTGGILNIDYIRKTSRHWGLAFSLKNHFNPYDSKRLEDKLRNFNPNPQWDIKSNQPYYFTDILIGEQFSLPLNNSEKLFLDIKGQVGLTLSKYAKTNIDAKVKPSPYDPYAAYNFLSQQNTSSDLTPSFAYTLATSLKLAIKPNYYLMAGVEYYSSFVSYKVKYDSENNSNKPFTTNLDLNIHLINITCGVIYIW